MRTEMVGDSLPEAPLRTSYRNRTLYPVRHVCYSITIVWDFYGSKER